MIVNRFVHDVVVESDGKERFLRTSQAENVRHSILRNSVYGSVAHLQHHTGIFQRTRSESTRSGKPDQHVRFGRSESIASGVSDGKKDQENVKMMLFGSKKNDKQEFLLKNTTH